MVLGGVHKEYVYAFPSPCGVWVRKDGWIVNVARYGLKKCFRPLAGYELGKFSFRIFCEGFRGGFRPLAGYGLGKTYLFGIHGGRSTRSFRPLAGYGLGKGSLRSPYRMGIPRAKSTH